MYKNGKPSYNEIVFDDVQLLDIKQSYLNGESSVKIGKRYGVSHKIILKQLHKMDVKVNQKMFVRKYNVDEYYFDNIDSCNKAYILGFLFADGHNDISKGTVTMSLQECDMEILEKIRKELKSDKPLEFLDYSQKKNFGYTYKNQYRLNVFSSHMCKSLFDFGMMPNKSLLLDFPNIPNVYYKDFIRGYFDGNGSFCPHISKNGNFQPLVTITSTENFCNKARGIIQNEINIPCGNVYDASCHNGVTKVISFSGKNQVYKFFNWIYSDAELYLDRKYTKYNEAFNNSLLA